MKWFGKRSQSKLRRKVSTEAVSLSTLFRWYCYDLSIDDVRGFSARLGMVPISEDAEEFELRASQERLDRVSRLNYFIQTMAELNTEVMHEISKEKLADVDIPEDLREQIFLSYKSSIFTASMFAIVSTLSAGLALGVIDDGKVTPAGLTTVPYDKL